MRILLVASRTGNFIIIAFIIFSYKVVVLTINVFDTFG